jgi:hypothetical protein
MKTSNYVLTAIPPILFRQRGNAKDDEGLFFRIYGTKPPAPLKEFTRTYMVPRTPEYKAMEAATTVEDRKLLSALALLARAGSMRKSASTAKDLYDATGLLIRDYQGARSAFADADPRHMAWVGPRLLNEQIRNAKLRMVFLRRGEPAVPCIVCDDLRTAVFVSAAYRGVELCAGCQRLFVPNPQRPQKYCSENCGQRIYQRRHRRRQKSKKSKSSKGG